MRMLLLALCFCSPVALADKIWVCDQTGVDPYLSSPEKGLNGMCREVTVAELNSEFPTLAKEFAKMNEKRPTSAFCKSDPKVVCTGEGEPLSGSIAGVPFSLHHDNSGSVSGQKDAGLDDYKSYEKNWNIGCRKDKITLAKMCSINKGNLFVFLYPGRERVSVGSSHFPRSTSAIRLGAKLFETSDRDGTFSQAALIPSMRDGTPIVTRYMKWPYRSYVDEEYELYGIEAALKLTRWLLKNGKIQ